MQCKLCSISLDPHFTHSVKAIEYIDDIQITRKMTICDICLDDNSQRDIVCNSDYIIYDGLRYYYI